MEERRQKRTKKNILVKLWWSEDMASVPIGFWPHDFSTLFTVLMIVTWLSTSIGVFSIEMGAFITLIFGIGIIADQEFFGPRYYKGLKMRKDG
jgi:hypothetical protein